MKNAIFIFSFVIGLVFCTLASFTVFSQENWPQQEQEEEQSFTEAELAQMLAPIALYPDSLLTHILIASTYPIEIVEAHRWLLKNEQLNSTQLAKSVEDFEWDASVKALVPFERILSRLSEDLSWTQQLGDAFLQDEERLLESIQALREQAKLAGNLDKMENMEVSYEDNNIVIEPREKEVVYVPYYDTRMIYGTWHWSTYPPVYWTPHRSIFVNRHRPFYWHSGIHISFDYFFSAFHWHNRHVVVINSSHAHKSYRRYYHQRPRRLVASGGYAKRWEHQPKHRKGVAYRTKNIRHKYHSNRVSVHTTNKKRHTAYLNNNQPNKAQHRVQHALSAKKHATSKKELTRGEVNSRAATKKGVTHKERKFSNKENSRPVSMGHSPKAKVIRSQKEHSSQKGHSSTPSKSQERAAKMVPRGKKENASKHSVPKHTARKYSSAKVSEKNKSAQAKTQQHNKSRKLN